MLGKLRAQLSSYFARARGSRKRALGAIGVHDNALDNAFVRGRVDIGFLSQVLDEMGLDFEDFVWDAFDFDSRPRGHRRLRGTLPPPKEESELGFEPEEPEETEEPVEPARSQGTDFVQKTRRKTNRMQGGEEQ